MSEIRCQECGTSSQETEHFSCDECIKTNDEVLNNRIIKVMQERDELRAQLEKLTQLTSDMILCVCVNTSCDGVKERELVNAAIEKVEKLLK